MTEPPVENAGDMLYFVHGSVAYAGHWVHRETHAVHTHSFVEVAVVTGGAGVHVSLAGPQKLAVGDVVLLRPGVWHGYENCRDLDVFNCCFFTELLQRELAWTREDPLLGFLLWTGPYSGQRRGMLTTRLGPDDMAECITHLDALEQLRFKPISGHRGDVIGRLAIFLSCVARTLGRDPVTEAAPTHPAVVDAMRMMESDPAHPWTLTELSAALHLAPGYLVRVFKAATGLPPIAYLSRHRVEVAAAKLLHTDDPISRIGEAVGWPDQNYFARRFKAHYGLSASAYRSRFEHKTVRMRAWPRTADQIAAGGHLTVSSQALAGGSLR
jgi:AraC family transcriptional regulator, L-rhamnose operon transcriptional activator RhaR